ncbi:bifunctional adenosylcobinamide kinase/adenosylcobinamide-phosphate guanylyltransferase [Variovorax sp. J22R133]|uniref:bifunctional adenosylcobinamide kinase/adenosylcobinamide-phosphate guanylyltransferase n=1 Tax=Variovorax brevis TaxID=3053503 RepID=UPI002576BFA1|nr:bifunctional adenosylcobinamide kinase/adenosylcobinamide-phosphate guanylyltransferase [Variovorax sp. J22R133]MDM0112535.1 bifunctional adenosylcobinamide kinase/adenosylcobinamide-phosphate guanylyltransferase [Variovorax sp. J22R133]
MNIAGNRELILGGQKSGKSRRAEQIAAAWLAADAQHCAVLVATAQAHDEEMRQRIARHRSDRARRVPLLRTVEEPLALGAAVSQHSAPQTLVVVDCLTLWLTNRMMPVDGGAPPAGAASATPEDLLLAAIRNASGPLVLVSNEIGLGVIPMGAEVRAFVDSLGLLNQQVAAACDRVTLMAAGLPLSLKGEPR